MPNDVRSDMVDAAILLDHRRQGARRCGCPHEIAVFTDAHLESNIRFGDWEAWLNSEYHEVKEPATRRYAGSTRRDIKAKCPAGRIIFGELLRHDTVKLTDGNRTIEPCPGDSCGEASCTNG